MNNERLLAATDFHLPVKKVYVWNTLPIAGSHMLRQESSLLEVDQYAIMCRRTLLFALRYGLVRRWLCKKVGSLLY